VTRSRAWAELHSTPRRRGFTLVEVAAVAVLMALLAGGVALTFAGPVQRMRAGEALDRVRTFDAAARLAARRSGRAADLTFDLRAGTLARADGPAAGRREVTYQATLPGGYRIDRLRATGGQAGGGPIDASSGLVTLYCSPDGLARTYALRVVGPGLDQWVVFAGLTGQVTLVEDERAVDAILDSARPRSRD
jgi:prepilin-type N-terminal cleavage/methylation domain-containing protein